MKPSFDNVRQPPVRKEHRETSTGEVRVAAPGFADLFAAALELPLDRLQTDPVWCVARLASTALPIRVS